MCPRMADAEAYNRCAIEVMRRFAPHLANGIPSINAPVMEPLHFPLVESSRDLGILNVNFRFKNLEIFGLTNSTFTNYKANLDKLTVIVKARVPHLTFRGDYAIKGKIFVVPLGGNGKFEGDVRKYLADL